jgi:hypothetical protein
MAKIIPFPKNLPDQRVAEKLVKVSQNIDAVILEALTDPDIQLSELTGIVAHRLGSLMRNIDERSELWPFYEQLVRKQAHLDKVQD